MSLAAPIQRGRSILATRRVFSTSSGNAATTRTTRVSVGRAFEDARYLGPTLGRFLSEDPNFVTAGAPDWVTGIKGDPNNIALSTFANTKSVNYLSNPQNLNAYSYVDNNPIRFKDQTGKFLVVDDAAEI